MLQTELEDRHVNDLMRPEFSSTQDVELEEQLAGAIANGANTRRMSSMPLR
jgi:hypothetical protein